MSEYFGGWMQSIAGSALICSAAITLTPNGKVKSVLKLVCGLLLITAMLTPIINSRAPAMSMSISQYRSRAQELTGQAQKNSNELSRTIIEDELEAYILDKARDSGEAPESVKPEMCWSSEGHWYPQSVTIVGEGMSAAAKKSLENLIEAELGVPAERQYWSGYEN